jgi:hypothetical protein
MNKLRQWIQYYLGILSLEKAAQKRNTELRQGISMLVDKINLLENGMVAGNRHSELSERLGRIENMFTSQHVPRRVNAEVYDWEQVQAMELAYMQMNPQKEDI